MATSGTVTRDLASEVGIAEAAVYRYARALRGADLLPAGTDGRGMRTGHYNDRHLAYLILALVGGQPAEAVETAQQLAGLQYLGTQPEDITPPASEKGSFLDVLTAFIRADIVYPLMIEFSFGLAVTATVFRELEDGREQRDVYSEPGGSHPRSISMFRKVIITHRLIAIAHELWADTMAQQGDMFPPVSGAAPASAKPENENAADPARTAAPTRDDQSRDARGSSQATKAEPKLSLAKRQALSASRAGRSHQSKGIDTAWLPAAP